MPQDDREDKVTTMVVLHTAEVLRRDRSLKLAEALDEAFADMARSVHLYRKKASLTLTVRLVPEDAGRVSILASIDEHLPKPAPRALVAYLDRGGVLHEEDPRQINLPLAPVEDFPAEGEAK